jgi:hypothetical protein
MAAPPEARFRAPDQREPPPGENVRLLALILALADSVPAPSMMNSPASAGFFLL